MRKPIIAITAGDPGGVGPEVITKCFQNFKPRGDVKYLLFGSKQPFDYLRKTRGLELPLFEINDYSLSSLREDAINFFDVTPEAAQMIKKVKKRVQNVVYPEKGTFHFEKGCLSAVNACITHASLHMAASYAAEGFVDAIVTAPINKTTMRLIDSEFQGHTEFLAKTSGARRFAMMFVSDRLKVTLATIHEPIKKVSSLITTKLVSEKIKLTDQFLRTYFNLKKPRIAVCALNPHGNETGTEDEKFIRPAVKEAREKKIEAVGPLSADQLFHEAYEGHYDAVISMYHDQGLAPFKMVAFQDGVNVTLGLPYIRTSPDHGTAFDIAYREEADPSSMLSALRLAEKLFLGTGEKKKVSV